MTMDEIDPGGVVPESGERFEARHGHCVAHRRHCRSGAAGRAGRAAGPGSGRSGVVRRSGRPAPAPRPGSRWTWSAGEPLGVGRSRARSSRPARPPPGSRATPAASTALSEAAQGRGTSTLTKTTRFDAGGAPASWRRTRDEVTVTVGARARPPARCRGCRRPGRPGRRRCRSSNWRLTSAVTATPGTSVEQVGLDVEEDRVADQPVRPVGGDRRRGDEAGRRVAASETAQRWCVSRRSGRGAPRGPGRASGRLEPDGRPLRGRSEAAEPSR